VPSTSDRLRESKGACARRWVWVVLGVCLALSAFRFEREVHQTMVRCCYDFPIFWEAADRYLRTHELYSDDLRRYEPAAAVYKFPPLAMAPIVVCARLGFGDQVYGLHMGVQVALYLGSVLLLLVTLECSRAWRRAALVLILALNHGPFYETLIGLQVETWILFLLVAAFLFMSRGMERGTGAALAVAAMLKVYPALMLAYLVAARRWQAASWFILVSVCLLAGTLAVFGAQETLTYFLRILPHMSAETAVDSPENAGVAKYLAYLFGLAPIASRDLARAITAIPLMISVALARRESQQTAHTACSGIGYVAFVPVMLLVLPNSWTNYQLLLLLPIAYLLCSFRKSTGMLPLALAAVAYVLMANHLEIQGAWSRLPLNATAQDVWWTLRGMCPWLVWLAIMWHVTRRTEFTTVSALNASHA
jgi:hypothetical protein